ncbi:GPO family capsid scaffolding protein [Altererythrobacter fulvus]|uniref:GPO family capsid scaffolding protein n=1 Tax=Caenibius fulvus TaxID=2126012 RepID=UPI0030194B87
MAKTKFFRVAVEGDTVDGRKIDRAHIEQMAATYDRATYTARINCEHLRGYSPQPPFNAYGSVDALKTEEVTLKLGGKDQTRLALLASFDVNDQARALTEADQKVFSSIEIAPNFANSGKAYLYGLALTDTPASLGTEVLKFSTREDARKDNLIAISDAFSVEFEDEAEADTEVRGAFAAMRKFFEGFTAPQVEKPAQQLPPAPIGQGGGSPSDLAAFAAAMTEGMDKLATAFTASQAKTETRMAKLAEDFATLQGEIEKAKPQTYRARPVASGGGDRERAVC